MIFYTFKNIVKNNSEILILSFILISFIVYYFSVQKKQEGVCVSKPFSFKQKNKKSGSPGSGEMSGTASSSTTQDMIQAYVSIVDSIESDMSSIKKIIPINFALGVVNNVDTPSNISINGKLPNIFLSFSIQNPPYGPTGVNGTDAPPYGEIGEVGPTGTIGETGYWGTMKNTLY